MNRPWHRFETLRPDQLRSAVRERPVLAWPLGLIEHHGYHLPVGYDGIKAERICIRILERTGGVLLPVMWWGALGGHGDFAWTLYQQPEAAERILRDSADRLVRMGFRVLVLLAGHYPWETLFKKTVPELQRAHPQVLFLAGTEVSLAAGLGLALQGDHAARWETTYGLALLPELVDMGALSPGRTADSSQGQPNQYPQLQFDPAHPLFAQLGEDPRGTANALDGQRLLDSLCDRVAEEIQAHLSIPPRK